MHRPLILLAPDEPATGGEPAAPEAPVPVDAPEAVAPVVTPPAAAPWAADIAAALEAEDPAAALDEFMRTKQQPYVTKLEAERKEALDKSWLFDTMNEDPVAGLQELAEQVWGPEVATRMLELVSEGATPEEAEAIVEAEGEATPDLSKLSPEVREAVEFAQSEKAAREAAAAAATESEAQAAIEAEYMAWHEKTLKDNPDIVGHDLHAYVATHDDMEAGLAAYRAAHPAPEKPAPPPTIGGSTTGGIPATRPSGGSFADTMGGIWDQMAGTAPR